MIKHLKLKLIMLLLFPLGLLISFLAGHLPTVTERIYSRGIYRALSTAYSFIFGIFSFSVAEIALFILIIAAIIWIVLQIVKAIKKRNILPVVNIVLTGASIFSLISLSFTLLWGLNYKRVPLDISLALEHKPKTADLVSLAETVVDNVNNLTAEIEYDEDGKSVYKGGFSKMVYRVNDGYSVIEKKLPVFKGAAAKPKPVLLSYPMCFTYITGIYIPFTFEPNINYMYPDFILPMTMSHESAHLKGFAREDEAEFAAYLSCINSPDIYYQYSGYLNAYMRLSGSLGRADREAADAFYSRLDSRAKGDISYFGEFCDRFKSEVAEISEKINDSYLKSQGEEKGVLSYDEVVRLMLLYHIEAESDLQNIP